MRGPWKTSASKCRAAGQARLRGNIFPCQLRVLRFDVNPNTGEAIGRERRRVVADNAVFHERGRESRVVLPVVPVESSKSPSSAHS